MNGDPGKGDAVVSIESTAEWQVHDILYDGQERYVAPLTFSDFVAKYARRVDWRKLVGSETSADDYNEDEGEEEVADAPAVRQPTSDNELHKLLSGSGADEQGDGEKTQQSEFGEEGEEWTGFGSKADVHEQDTDVADAGHQGVGPWDSLAKRLYQSLTEMNVLLDTIQVARSGKYLVLDPVQQEPIEQPKGAVLAAKKKALTSASAVLLSLADQMKPKTTPSSPSAQQQLDPELEELMEMRKNWRLKKVGNAIVGDLSYFTAGKYRPNATFEVKKAEKAMSGSAMSKGQNMWRVVLPKDLEESLRLRVTIEPSAGGGATFSYFGSRPHPKLSSSGWKEKLQSAQRTLFCRDLFAQLAREAAHVTDLCCAVRGRSIIIRLPYEHSLCLSLDSFGSDQQSESGPPPPEESVFVLEHNLQQLFDAELEGSNRVIIPRPVAAPLTHLSKKARLAGPDALSASALGSESESDKYLIQRILDQTLHFLFYQRSKAVIDEFAATYRDPLVMVHWCPETTAVWSMVRIQMSTPYYDYCGRTLIMLEIGIDTIKATLRDGEVVTLSSNLQELEHFLKLRARQHIISAVGLLCRPHQWQTLYSNPCQVDESGQLAPAILVGHPAGTSAICVRYPLIGDPVILIQASSEDKPNRLAGDLLAPSEDGHALWSCLRNALRSLTYEQMPGNNFLHKIELLIATLT